jgi:hypothetical protein
MDDEMTMEDESMFEGTFHGIEGTYTCTDNAGCTIVSDDMGMLSMLGGTWTFTATADDAEGMVAAVDTDDDYLDFGYWVQTMTDAEGAETYMVHAFARGSDTYGNVDDVEGSATYTGGAAGLYSRSVFDSAGKETILGGGRFAAEVELKAYFGGPTITPENTDSISGKVFNFSASGDDAVNTWVVNLPKVQANVADTGTWTNGTFGSTAIGTDVDTSWTGTFYGPNEDDAQPTGVAGTFQQELSTRTITGAYGATQ